jgi:hypothetical protein
MNKEYIEREAAINKFSDLLPIGRSIRQSILEVPVADVAPVIHGEWEVYTEYYNFGLYQVGWRCSLCGRIETDKQPYCNCGAKMDGGKD